MKKFLALLLAFVMIFTLVGCQGENKNSEQNEPNTTTETNTENSKEESGEKEDKASEETFSVDELVLTYVTSPLNVPSIIEKEQNVFGDALKGVKVNYSEITSGSEQSQALASGDVQFLHAIGGTSIVAAAAGGLDIRIINMYSRAPEAFCMYTKDPNIKEAKDLKGKKIAGPMGTNLHELLVSYLKANDMTLDDVEYVNLGIPDAYAALEGGSLDCALLGGPAAYKADQAGFHKVVDGKDYIKAIIAVATTQKYYDEHKDVIDKLVEAQKSLRTYMEEHPEETKAMVMEALNIDEKAYDTMFPQYDFSVEVTDKDIEGLQKTADFMLEAGMIEEPIDVSTLFIK